jgi:hypothetical protein
MVFQPAEPACGNEKITEHVLNKPSLIPSRKGIFTACALLIHSCQVITAKRRLGSVQGAPTAHTRTRK